MTASPRRVSLPNEAPAYSQLTTSNQSTGLSNSVMEQSMATAGPMPSEELRQVLPNVMQSLDDAHGTLQFSTIQREEEFHVERMSDDYYKACFAKNHGFDPDLDDNENIIRVQQHDLAQRDLELKRLRALLVEREASARKQVLSAVKGLLRHVARNLEAARVRAYELLEVYMSREERDAATAAADGVRWLFSAVQPASQRGGKQQQEEDEGDSSLRRRQDEIDSMFRLFFEELQLRWSASRTGYVMCGGHPGPDYKELWQKQRGRIQAMDESLREAAKLVESQKAQLTSVGGALTRAVDRQGQMRQQFITELLIKAERIRLLDEKLLSVVGSGQHQRFHRMQIVDFAENTGVDDAAEPEPAEEEDEEALARKRLEKERDEFRNQALQRGQHIQRLEEQLRRREDQVKDLREELRRKWFADEETDASTPTAEDERDSPERHHSGAAASTRSGWSGGWNANRAAQPQRDATGSGGASSHHSSAEGKSAEVEEDAESPQPEVPVTRTPCVEPPPAEQAAPKDYKPRSGDDVEVWCNVNGEAEWASAVIVEPQPEDPEPPLGAFRVEFPDGDVMQVTIQVMRPPDEEVSDASRSPNKSKPKKKPSRSGSHDFGARRGSEVTQRSSIRSQGTSDPDREGSPAVRSISPGGSRRSVRRSFADSAVGDDMFIEVESPSGRNKRGGQLRRQPSDRQGGARKGSGGRTRVSVDSNLPPEQQIRELRQALKEADWRCTSLEKELYVKSEELAELQAKEHANMMRRKMSTRGSIAPGGRQPPGRRGLVDDLGDLQEENMRLRKELKELRDEMNRLEGSGVKQRFDAMKMRDGELEEAKRRIEQLEAISQEFRHLNNLLRDQMLAAEEKLKAAEQELAAERAASGACQEGGSSVGGDPLSPGLRSPLLDAAVAATHPSPKSPAAFSPAREAQLKKLQDDCRIHRRKAEHMRMLLEDSRSQIMRLRAAQRALIADYRAFKEHHRGCTLAEGGDPNAEIDARLRGARGASGESVIDVLRKVVLDDLLVRNRQGTDLAPLDALVMDAFERGILPAEYLLHFLTGDQLAALHSAALRIAPALLAGGPGDPDSQTSPRTQALQQLAALPSELGEGDEVQRLREELDLLKQALAAERGSPAGAREQAQGTFRHRNSGGGPFASRVGTVVTEWDGSSTEQTGSPHSPGQSSPRLRGSAAQHAVQVAIPAAVRAELAAAALALPAAAQDDAPADGGASAGATQSAAAPKKVVFPLRGPDMIDQLLSLRIEEVRREAPRFDAMLSSLPPAARAGVQLEWAAGPPGRKLLRDALEAAIAEGLIPVERPGPAPKLPAPAAAAGAPVAGAAEQPATGSSTADFITELLRNRPRADSPRPPPPPTPPPEQPVVDETPPASPPPPPQQQQQQQQPAESELPIHQHAVGWPNRSAPAVGRPGGSRSVSFRQRAAASRAAGVEALRANLLRGSRPPPVLEEQVPAAADTPAVDPGTLALTGVPALLDPSETATRRRSLSVTEEPRVLALRRRPLSAASGFELSGRRRRQLEEILLENFDGLECAHEFLDVFELFALLKIELHDLLELQSQLAEFNVATAQQAAMHAADSLEQDRRVLLAKFKIFRAVEAYTALILLKMRRRKENLLRAREETLSHVLEALGNVAKTHPKEARELLCVAQRHGRGQSSDAAADCTPLLVQLSRQPSGEKSEDLRETLLELAEQEGSRLRQLGVERIRVPPQGLAVRQPPLVSARRTPLVRSARPATAPRRGPPLRVLPPATVAAEHERRTRSTEPGERQPRARLGSADIQVLQGRPKPTWKREGRGVVSLLGMAFRKRAHSISAALEA